MMNLFNKIFLLASFLCLLSCQNNSPNESTSSSLSNESLESTTVDDLEKGMVFIVPSWTWVTYETKGVKQPWSNGTTYSEIGDNCGVEFGSKLVIIGIIDEKTVLCKYVTNGDGLGTRCECNAIISISKDELITFNEHYVVAKNAEEKKRKKVEELLHGNGRSTLIVVVKKLGDDFISKFLYKV